MIRYCQQSKTKTKLRTARALDLDSIVPENTERNGSELLLRACGEAAKSKGQGTKEEKYGNLERAGKVGCIHLPLGSFSQL
jgi:hypothetical protein